ncbi:MAG: hypothetical protein ACRCZF_15460 [Gemmataceae bacterium]
MALPTSPYNFEENFPGSDFTPDETEFLRAVEAYQRRHQRRYPSCKEFLLILQSLGYRKTAPPEPIPRRARPRRYPLPVSPTSPPASTNSAGE